MSRLSPATVAFVCRVCRKASLSTDGEAILTDFPKSLIEKGFFVRDEARKAVKPTAKAFALWTATEGKGTEQQ